MNPTNDMYEVILARLNIILLNKSIIIDTNPRYLLSKYTACFLGQLPERLNRGSNTPSFASFALLHKRSDTVLLLTLPRM